MSTALAIRLAMTLAILVTISLQYPKFIDKATKLAEDAVDAAEKRRNPEASQAKVDRQVRNGKILLLSSYAILLLVAWLVPLPV